MKRTFQHTVPAPCHVRTVGNNTISNTHFTLFCLKVLPCIHFVTVSPGLSNKTGFYSYTWEKNQSWENTFGSWFGHWRTFCTYNLKKELLQFLFWKLLFTHNPEFTFITPFGPSGSVSLRQTSLKIKKPTRQNWGNFQYLLSTDCHKMKIQGGPAVSRSHQTSRLFLEPIWALLSDPMMWQHLPGFCFWGSTTCSPGLAWTSFFCGTSESPWE